MKQRWLITLAKDPMSNSDAPMPNRVRSLLKHALRVLKLKNQEVREVGEQWTIAFEMSDSVLGDTLSMRVGQLVDKAWIWGLRCVGLKSLHKDGTPVQISELPDHSIARGIK